MKTFKQFLREQDDRATGVSPNFPHVTVEPTAKGVDEPGVLDKINVQLAKEANGPFITAYVGLERARKVLAYFGITVPAAVFLTNGSGEASYPVHQFGAASGIDASGQVTKPEEPKLVFFYVYSQLPSGEYYCESHVVHKDDLQTEEVLNQEGLDYVYESEVNEEQIDELSKGTLGRYVKAAQFVNVVSAYNRGSSVGRGKGEDSKVLKKEINHAHGIHRAVNKLVKEEQIDEGTSRIDPKTAHDILTKHDAHRNFFTLPSSTVGALVDHAKEHKYRKGKNAPGSTGRMFHGHLTRLAAHHKPVNEETILESTPSGLSPEAHELVLHADNTHHLYRSSHEPIMKNLKKKAQSGKYDPEKAKKLWKYHADRASQSYKKEHGNASGKGTHAFSPEHRKEAAAHWEDNHREELHHKG
jgi:hypothetical protein